MDEFEFQKVHFAMMALDWKWHDSEAGIPSIPELRKLARRLLLEVKTETGSGGFYAKADQWGRLSLEFVLDSWTFDPEGVTISPDANEEA